MSETKKKTTESKTKKSAAEKKTASKTNKKTTVKKSTEPKAKRLTKEEKAALEREQARLAAEKAERDKEKRAIKDEVAIIISIAVAILLLLSNFKLSGIVGEVVNGALFGLFGWLAYLVPLLIVVLVCFFLANRNNGFRFGRVVNWYEQGCICCKFNGSRYRSIKRSISYYCICY